MLRATDKLKLGLSQYFCKTHWTERRTARPFRLLYAS